MSGHRVAGGWVDEAADYSDRVVDLVRKAAENQARAVSEAIERACEKALTGGEHGVLVLTSFGLPYAAGPHPWVPYGEIHYLEHKELAGGTLNVSE